ncbi:MAG: peptidoglycan DD-metalloendopeptidase family protein [Saprospiraceae bacterium]|nr:peptidoglycan DD-metalloendopeptidase family protein [Saprospiraceae bacterium]
MSSSLFRYIFILFIPAYILSSCRSEKIPEPFQASTAYEAYLYSLKEAGLAQKALGRKWVEAGEEIFERAHPIAPPHKEAFYFDPQKADAAGYRFEVLRGQAVSIQLESSGESPYLVFMDLFRVEDDSLSIYEHVASADTISRSIWFEPRRDADYILRLQPELLYGGHFSISILNRPSLDFPVSGKDSRAIGSYFGDPRDGGRRDHHGVDIFASRHTPIIAPTDGYIRYAGEREGSLGGRVVWMRDEKRKQTLYFAHLEEVFAKEDTYAKKGDTLGTVGNSGNARSTPPHLHFGIYSSGPVDPFPFINMVDTSLTAIEADTSLVGTWARTDRPASLRLDLEGSSYGERTLERHQLVRPLAAFGNNIRVALPDGTIGNLYHYQVESIEMPLNEKELDTSLPVLNSPYIPRSTIQTLDRGEVVSILGKNEGHWYVSSKKGISGWVAAP